MLDYRFRVCAFVLASSLGDEKQRMRHQCLAGNLAPFAAGEKLLHRLKDGTKTLLVIGELLFFLVVYFVFVVFC